MSHDLIDQLVAGQYRDPDTGEPVSVGCRSVVIAERLDGSEAELVQGLGLGQRLAVVSDPATHAAMGARIERALASVAQVEAIHFPDSPHADVHTAAQLEARCTAVDALVAVGSGTINDLCKYTAARLDRPYVVFGTAPSMNGYTSVNATMMVDRHKKSLPARAPAGVFLDLQVLAHAPTRLIRSGLGDSLCRPTAQADWLLSHLLLDTPYRRLPFDLLLTEEDALLAAPEALVAGDLAAMGRLARTLILSGFGMTIAGGSWPASQGEHLISHYADMMRRVDQPRAYHGEQIGVTTLTMARVQEHLLHSSPPVVMTSHETEVDLMAQLGDELGRSCWKELSAKHLDAERAGRINERIRTSWPDFQQRLARVTRPAHELQRVLEQAGAPTRPEDLGWSPAFYRSAVESCWKIRNRFTFLDLAAGTSTLSGILDAAGYPA